MRILIVDDNPELREVLVGTLDLLGHEAVEAEDGAKALRLLDEQPLPDLVLSDIKMPNVDGMALLEKCSQRYPELPIAMMSGHADLSVAVAALKQSAFDFLLKPFDIEAIERLIERVPDLDELDLFPTAQGSCREATLELSIETSLLAVRTATRYLRRQLEPHCRELGLRLDNIGLCLAEALNNAVVHGNMDIPSSLKDGPDGWQGFQAQLAACEADPEIQARLVKIRCQVAAESLVIQIVDEGEGFDFERFANVDPGVMQSHGRGLLLMREISDELDFVAPGNELRLRFDRRH